MALADEITRGSSLAFDSDALIYYVEEHDRFYSIVEPVVELVSTGQVRAHISTINLLEVLVRPLREGQQGLATRYRELLTNPNDFALHHLTAQIAERAAAIRAEYRVAVADAIVAASAIEAGCNYLITNNGDDFRNIRGIRALIINDFVTA